MPAGKNQEVLEQDATIARVIWMLPARAALVPVFERLFEMELDRVDHLPLSALHHHLVATEIRRRQQLETFRYAVELQTVILPDTQDACGRFRIRIDVFENRIFGLRNADEAILILVRPRQTLLVLLEFIERDHACTKTQTNKLMTAADREHWSFGIANEASKVLKYRLHVIIKIAQRAAQHDRVRLKILRGLSDVREVCNFCGRALNQTRDVIKNIFNRHAGDEALASHFGGEGPAPLRTRH